MLLLTFIPTLLGLLLAVSAAPADTNAERMRRGLPLKPPGTAVRRQGPTVSQGTTSGGGTNGVMMIGQRINPTRRSLQERAAPASGYLAFDGSRFVYTSTAANAAVFNFPSDSGTDQPFQVVTSTGSRYLSIVSSGNGIYDLITSPTPDASTKFSWRTISAPGGQGLAAKLSDSSIYFRLNSLTQTVYGVSSFGESQDLNPIWLYTTKAPSAIGGSAALQAEADKMLKLTNDYRAQYGADSLTYSPTIAAYAQGVADKCAFAHSENNPYGENLFTGSFNMDSSDAIQGWVLYDWSKPGFSLATGHFTALVWKATTQMGCAWKLCPPNSYGNSNEQLYIVCNYSPPGNVENQFEQNVGTKIV